MILDHIDAETRVLPVAAPIDYEGGPDAVLLLHGWTGWTGRLRYLAERLRDEGYTVHAPRLPGHGTSVADLLQSTASDWIRRATDAYLDLRSRHERIRVVGTSMGSILAALVSARFGAERLALLAPAFINRNRLIHLAPALRYFVPRVRTKWTEDLETDPREKEIGAIYSTWNYTRSVAELLKLQRIGRRSLPSLRAPTLVVVSRMDTAVPPSVAELIRERANGTEVKVLEVEHSNHQLALDLDRDQVIDEVVRWLR